MGRGLIICRHAIHDATDIEHVRRIDMGTFDHIGDELAKQVGHICRRRDRGLQQPLQVITNNRCLLVRLLQRLLQTLCAAHRLARRYVHTRAVAPTVVLGPADVLAERELAMPLLLQGALPRQFRRQHRHRIAQALRYKNLSRL